MFIEKVPPISRVAAALLAVMCGLLVWGIWANRLLAQDLWEPTGLERMGWTTAAYAVLAAALFRPRRSWLPGAAAAAMLAFTVWDTGWSGVAAAGLFFAAAAAAGDLLVRAGDALEALVALACGTTFYTFVFSFTAHVPVNRPALWFVLLAAPVAWRARRSISWRPAAWRPSGLEYAAAALAGFVLCLHWLVALNPETGADALAMHLAAPAYVAQHYGWAFDFRHFIWAVMPMNADWAYSIAYLLGGEAAAHLVNYGLLLALCALVFRMARMWLPTGGALLVTAAFASAPLVQLETGSLFVENFWAFLLLGALAALERYRRSGVGRFALASAVLLGAAVGSKFGALAFAAALAPWLWREARRHQHSRAVLAGTAVVFALPPYAYAWAATGNPTYPYLNRWFRSPWFDAQAALVDPRYPAALSWRALWDATFHSARLLEGQNGSLGFLALLALPPALLLLRRRSPWVARPAAAMALAGATSVLATQAYLRYLYPALPLVALLAAALLAGSRRWYPALCGGLAALTGLQLYFLPAAGWNHRDLFALPREREAYLARHAPERLLIEYMNRAHPGAPVAFLKEDLIAGLEGPAYTASWHTADFSRQLNAARSPEEVLALAGRHGIRYFVAPAPASGVRLPALAAETFLARYTVPEKIAGDAYVARLGTPGEQEQTRPPAPAGEYDDRDARIEYSGRWWRDDQFARAGNGTLTYSDEPGAEARFRFSGTRIVYRFTRAANRGRAEVRIDGRVVDTLDERAAETAWQAQAAWDRLGAGTHTIAIRVGAPREGGNFVDLDGFVVSGP